MQTKPYRLAVLTSSDKAAEGLREDQSGPIICKMAQDAGYVIVETAVLADDAPTLRAQLEEWCGSGEIDLILTTGGTGFAPRDVMPEVTAQLTTRPAPGIAEALRVHSLAITPRAMFSRAAAGICKSTLIINLPGSPKAVRECMEYLLPSLAHGLDILTEADGECAR